MKRRNKGALLPFIRLSFLVAVAVVPLFSMSMACSAAVILYVECGEFIKYEEIIMNSDNNVKVLFVQPIIDQASCGSYVCLCYLCNI